MPSCFCISIRFLQPMSHGRGEGGEPEWPPSPLRVFQSLSAAAAARWNERQQIDYAAPALSWLECMSIPKIVAAIGESSHVKCQFYVPDNIGDLVASGWTRGDSTRSVKRSEKVVRPTHLNGEAVHYLYPLDKADQSFEMHRETLFAAARSITHLGWGIDMVVGKASVISEEDATKLPGVRWEPVEDAAATRLRVPVKGTLDALIAKHKAFLNRIGPDGFRPVPPLRPGVDFSVQGYRRTWEPAAPRIAAFEFLKLDTSGWRSFDKLKACHVAGMLRHAAAEAAEQAGWDKHRINAFVLGHGEKSRQDAHQPVGPERFAYIPLPSLISKGGDANIVADIRRALIFVPAGGHEAEINWARRALSGCELIDEKSRSAQAIISLIRDSDRMVTRYTQPSSVWATVTPVILPGYDDPKHYRRRIKKGVSAAEQRRLLERLSDRIDNLFRKAMIQAGFSETLAEHAEIEWRKVGYWPGADRSDRFFVPMHLRKFPAYHVRIRWHDPSGNAIRITGPIVLGGARYSGLGLFAAME